MEFRYKTYKLRKQYCESKQRAEGYESDAMVTFAFRITAENCFLICEQFSRTCVLYSNKNVITVPVKGHLNLVIFQLFISELITSPT